MNQLLKLIAIIEVIIVLMTILLHKCGVLTKPLWWQYPYTITVLLFILAGLIVVGMDHSSKE